MQHPMLNTILFGTSWRFWVWTSAGFVVTLLALMISGLQGADDPEAMLQEDFGLALFGLIAFAFGLNLVVSTAIGWKVLRPAERGLGFAVGLLAVVGPFSPLLSFFGG